MLPEFKTTSNQVEATIAREAESDPNLPNDNRLSHAARKLLAIDRLKMADMYLDAALRAIRSVPAGPMKAIIAREIEPVEILQRAIRRALAATQPEAAP